MSAVFVNGHRYGYNRDSSNYYEGRKRTKNKTDSRGERTKIHQVLFYSVVSFVIVAAVSVVAMLTYQLLVGDKNFFLLGPHLLNHIFGM